MSKTEKWLPWIFFAAFAVLLGLDSKLWHPGFSFFDEGLGTVANVQLWREGRSLPFELFKGCIHRDLLAAVSALCGPSLGAWRGATLLALGLESLLLYALARRAKMARAGLWAICFNLSCALTFLRARSLLSYSILPLELLSLAWVLPYAKSRVGSFTWGLACALFLLDYEGWLLALPILVLAYWHQESDERPSALPAVLGFLALLLPLLWISRASLQSHLLLRPRSLPLGIGGAVSMLGQSLAGFFWGSQTFGYMGVSGHSAFPLWALPALLLGIILAWSRERWLLVWLCLGLLPMAIVGSAAEPNRLMAAWPVLCLLTGMGLSLIPSRYAPALAVILVLGCALEAKAYALSMQGQYDNYYGSSAGLIAVASQAKATHPQGMELISELDYESSAAERYVWAAYGPATGPAGAETLALVPWEYGISLQPSWGAQATAPGLILLQATPKAAPRLRAIQSELLKLRQALPRFDLMARRQGLLDYLRQNPHADPWVRTSAMEGALGVSFMIGDIPKELMDSILMETLASASVYAWLGQKAQFTDPNFARYVFQRALHKDPRRADLQAILSKMAVSH